MFEGLYKIKGPVCAIDVGYNSIKVIQLERKGQLTNLLGYNYLPIPPGILTSISEQDRQTLSTSIAKGLSQAKPRKIKTTTAISGLPESKVFTKVIQVPPMTQKEKEEAIPQEASRHIPMPIEQIYLDWQTLNLGDSTTEDVLIVAAPKILVDTYVEIFKNSGLDLLALETKPLAAGRALFSYQQKDASLIVDIGAEATGISVFDLNTIKFTYTIPHGGNTLTKAISTFLHITEEEADKIKRKTGLKDTAGNNDTKKALSQVMQDIIEEISNTIKFYEKRSNPKRSIKQILICGGGGYTPSLSEFIYRNVGISTKLGDPLINFNRRSIKKFPQGESLKYTTVIGLALRESL